MKIVDFVKSVAADERIPLQNRVILGGLLMYLMTPIDLIPDFIPIIGWLDDAFVTILILDYVFNSADTEIILEHYPWNKQHFKKMRTYVDRLSWLVPSGLKKLLFRQAKRIAVEKKPHAKKLTTAEE
jgi:uncharacterized membrane protein YkvA (DUF1232 family)